MRHWGSALFRFPHLLNGVAHRHHRTEWLNFHPRTEENQQEDAERSGQLYSVVSSGSFSLQIVNKDLPVELQNVKEASG
jgi:hypothetical protein